MVFTLLAGCGYIHPNLRESRHMTVMIDIPKEIEARLLSEAQASGIPFGPLVRDVLIDHFEEVEDRLVAESRLDERQAPISSHQLRKNLGLDN
jgi:predicted DNA-binding protein